VAAGRTREGERLESLGADRVGEGKMDYFCITGLQYLIRTLWSLFGIWFVLLCLYHRQNLRRYLRNWVIAFFCALIFSFNSMGFHKGVVWYEKGILLLMYAFISSFVAVSIIQLFVWLIGCFRQLLAR
jgi:hypothetical protein